MKPNDYVLPATLTGPPDIALKSIDQVQEGVREAMRALAVPSSVLLALGPTARMAAAALSDQDRLDARKAYLEAVTPAPKPPTS